jgi:hypothetical protein
MPPTIVARVIRVKSLFRLFSCARAMTDRWRASIHRSIVSLSLARIDLLRLRARVIAKARARRGGLLSVDGCG